MASLVVSFVALGVAVFALVKVYSACYGANVSDEQFDEIEELDELVLQVHEIDDGSIKLPFA